MTELVTTATAFDRATLVLKKEGKVTLKDLAEVLVSDNPPPPPVVAKPPKVLALTDEARAAIDALPKAFGTVQPDTVRAVTEVENSALYAEREILDLVMEPLKERREAISDAIKNHMDQVAVENGDVDEDTPIDIHGHYILASKGNPERVPIPETSKAWSREFRSGSANLRGDRLLGLYESGEITREVYLSMTREMRVFDEDKTMAALAKDPSLLTVIAKLAEKGEPSTSLFVRKA